MPVVAALAYVSAFSCVAALAIAAGHGSARLPARYAGGLFVASAALLGLLAWLGVEPGAPAVLGSSVLLLAGGSGLGAWVGGRVESPGHLLPVAVVSSLVDLASVLHPAGPSARLVESPGALALLAVWFPLWDAGRLAPILGVGDVVFCALYLAAARRHRLSARRTTLALAIGLLGTMGLVLATQLPLPALPLLGAGVVIALPEARRIPAADRRGAWIVMALLTVGVAALLWHRWYAASR